MRVLQSPVLFDPPVIDAVEARWAAEAVASLVRQLDSDSMVALCLDQTRHELMSLAASAVSAAPGEVIGPVRVRVAA
jgi:hypothetical protein